MQMNWLFFFLLGILTVINYILSDGKVLFPSVLVTGIFSFSALLLALNTSRWNFEIDVMTLLFIVSSLVLFSIGSLLGKRLGAADIHFVGAKKTKKLILSDLKDSRLEFSNATWTVLCILCIISTVLYTRNQYNIAARLGNPNGFFGMIGFLRNAMAKYPGVLRVGTVLRLLLSFTRACAYMSIFLITLAITRKERIRTYGKYFVPVICLCLNNFLSTARSGYIPMIALVMFDLYFVWRMQGRKRISSKIFIRGALGMVLFFALFRLLGTVTGKTSTLSLWDNISIYAGSGTLCFSKTFSELIASPRTWGAASFKGLGNMITLFATFFGADTETAFSSIYNSNHGSFVYWEGFSSNVYTAFRPYISDFGIGGALLMQLILGWLVTMLFKKIEDGKAGMVLTVTYGSLFGAALAYYPIAEFILSANLALNVFAELLAYVVIYQFVKKVPIVKPNKQCGRSL